MLDRELFSNVAHGQGYTYLVAQARHGKHSTWPDGGSENDPDQQYNLYQVAGRTDMATKLAKADYRWNTGQDSRNLTQFLFMEIVRFGTRTGILLQSQFGSAEEILYALY